MMYLYCHEKYNICFCINYPMEYVGTEKEEYEQTQGGRMVEGLRSLYPKARVGHIGLYRDEETLESHTYYFKLPKEVANGPVLIVDPALATGGSAAAAIKYIKDAGCKDIRLLCLIGAREGVERVHKDHPDVKIYLAKFADAPLNEHGYIVTAFGDAGDRIMGTFS